MDSQIKEWEEQSEIFNERNFVRTSRKQKKKRFQIAPRTYSFLNVANVYKYFDSRTKNGRKTVQKGKGGVEMEGKERVKKGREGQKWKEREGKRRAERAPTTRI